MLSINPETRKSLVIRGLRDLEAFGISPLTGEACALSQRILCDVSEEGRLLLAEYFGFPGLKLADNMNSQVAEQPAIGSVMLTRSSYSDLASFAFFRDGAHAIVRGQDNSIQGIYDKDLVQRYAEINADITRNPIQCSQGPRVGTRNVHQMTGRAL